MENAESRLEQVDVEAEKISEEFGVMQNVGGDLDDLWEDVETKNPHEVKAISDSLARLGSFKDLPLTIQYPDFSKSKLDKKEFPRTLDIRPKPIGNKRKTESGKLVDSPENLTICLDHKKFTLEPEIGSIKSISVDKGNVILGLKIGLLPTKLSYVPARLAKNIVKMWIGTPYSPDGKPRITGQIFGFTGSKVTRVK